MTEQEAKNYCIKKIFDDTTTEEEKDFLHSVSLALWPPSAAECDAIRADVMKYLREHLL